MKREEIVPSGERALLVVVGPTASGKTDLAIELAERLGGEVVSADSVQIYERFDIGSGKPTREERARAEHHLIGVVDPLAPMDAARFAEMADRAIETIRARGRVPIVCGGTYLWVKALVHGLAEAAPRDDEIRARHTRIAEERGRGFLHEELQRLDPEAAARLAPNDLVRVSRALEIHELTGKPMTEWHKAHGFATSRYDARLIGVRRAREEIDVRIETRAKRWLESGWIEEVERLLADGYGPSRAMGSVGYREVRSFIEGRLAREDLLPTIVRSTRVFVRRQRTWLRDEPVEWLD
ncbi:MAG: tRNA (adenosine(37)-N6)-dimethylallyltransferase MiaA [Polyangiaceae bacterium]|nr:tRNA (adenosine(37)-N6)-dimethylallyltransferase MiaA [Polyangiaceae bacterium]